MEFAAFEEAVLHTILVRTICKRCVDITFGAGNVIFAMLGSREGQISSLFQPLALFLSPPLTGEITSLDLLFGPAKKRRGTGNEWYRSRSREEPWKDVRLFTCTAAMTESKL